MKRNTTEYCTPNYLLDKIEKSAACYILIIFVVLCIHSCRKTAEDEPLYTNISQSAGVSYTPVIAIGDNDDVYVVWADSTPGNFEIFFSEGNNNGTWSQGINISNNTSISAAPFIATDNIGNVHVCWWDIEYDVPDTKISYRMRNASGDWADREVLAASSASDTAHNLPRIICDNENNVYVMWECFGHLYYKIKPPDSTWTDILVVPNAPASNPAELAADQQGNLHITWEGLDNNILYQIKTAAGIWQNRAVITEGVSLPVIPDITFDETGIVYIVWTARDSDLNRYGYYTHNQSGNWSTPIKLPMKDPDDVGWYFIITAEDNGTVHFIWENWTQDTAGYYGHADIYYTKKYADSTWSDVHNISNTVGRSICDVGGITHDEFGNIHIVWADDEEGVSDVFYFKIPADSL